MFFDPTQETAVAFDAIAYVDGACEPRNPGGTGGWGFVIRDAAGVLLKEGYGRLNARPDMTNNVAEYCAAGAAVKAYKELGRSGPLLVRGDSQLVVKQMSGEWRVKQGAYVEIYHRLQRLLTTCDFKVHWEWVPREQNTYADDLSKRALAEIGIRPVERRR